MGKILDRYRNFTVHRYDKDPSMHYFSLDDFPGLNAEEATFDGPHGETIRGFYYSYKNPKQGKLVVFSSGIGPGHCSYMREVERIARAGYKVLAYDNVGTGLSSGDDIRGMSESLADLDAVLNQLKTNDEITLIGHSWGGFAVGAIRNYHKEIKKVVIMSGFVFVENILKQSLHGLARFIRKTLMRYERKINPGYATASSLTAFEDDGADVLWLHSKDDHMVSYDLSLALAKKKYKSSRIEFVEFENKKHNPNYTEDAANYLVNTFAMFRKEYASKSDEEKKEFLSKIDWKRMTEQDEDVWNKVFALIEK